MGQGLEDFVIWNDPAFLFQVMTQLLFQRHPHFKRDLSLLLQILQYYIVIDEENYEFISLCVLKLCIAEICMWFIESEVSKGGRTKRLLTDTQVPVSVWTFPRAALGRRAASGLCRGKKKKFWEPSCEHMAVKSNVTFPGLQPGFFLPSSLVVVPSYKSMITLSLCLKINKHTLL